MELRHPDNLVPARAAMVHQAGQVILDAQAAHSFEEALHTLALRVRLVVGAHQCAISYVPLGDFHAALHSQSFSEKYAKYNSYDVMPTGQGIWGVVVRQKNAVRMTQEELESHPLWKNFSGLKDARGLEHPPMRGWLAAPVLRPTGNLLGVLQLSDKVKGEFTSEDLELLVHLANMALPTFELQYVNQQLQQRVEELRSSRVELELRVQERTAELTAVNEGLREEIRHREQAEAALRESEERLRLAQQAARIGTFEWNIQTGVNTWTPELEALYGLQSGAFARTQSAWEQLVHPADRALATRCIAEAFATGLSTQGEWRVIWPDGSLHWILGRFQVFRDESGRPLRLTGINLDISERKEAEEARRLSDERFRVATQDHYLKREFYDALRSNPAIIEFLEAGSLDGLWYWDLEQPENEWMSPQFWRTFGYQPEEKQHRVSAWQDLIFADDLTTTLDNFDKHCADPNHPYDQIVRYRHRDGSTVWVRCRGMAIRDAAGKPRRMLGAHTNVTAALLQQEQRIQEQQFRAFFERAAVGAVQADPQGRLLRVNDRFCEITGYNREELLGIEAINLDISEREDDRAEVARFLRGETPLYDREKRYVRKDRQIVWVHVTTSLIRDSAGRIVCTAGIVVDITERKQAEELLQEHAAELARSNAELEQFAYVASHDLQEPLRMVASFVQLLAQRCQGQLDARASEYIRYAVDGAARMKTLIEDLLTYSRAGRKSLSRMATDCTTVVTQAIVNLHEAIRERGATVVHDPLPTVWADPSQLSQVFQNLISNAIKFARPGEPPRVHISARLQEEEWVFAIRDNGLGIAPQHRERIFLVFQRLHTRQEYPGTGIGLAICKKVIERHGGRIWVESEPGAGSVFYFTLPARAPSRSESRMSGEPQPVADALGPQTSHGT